jgi:hypothetical protein
MCWKHNKCNIQQNYFLFLILQRNIDTIKAESDVDVEEDFIGTKMDEIYIPSAFSVKMTEPEVSLVFRFSSGTSCIVVCVLFMLFIIWHSVWEIQTVFLLL